MESVPLVVRVVVYFRVARAAFTSSRMPVMVTLVPVPPVLKAALPLPWVNDRLPWVVSVTETVADTAVVLMVSATEIAEVPPVKALLAARVKVWAAGTVTTGESLPTNVTTMVLEPASGLPTKSSVKVTLTVSVPAVVLSAV